MKIITISREFGSGGRELGKRLAEQMGYDYYDSEIITAVADKCGMDAGYVGKALENHGWRQYPVTYGRTMLPSACRQTDRIQLLLEQKKVIEEIAGLGKDFVIVGRNADMILDRYEPLNFFVCAQMDARVRRCMDRTGDGEQLTEKELIRKIRQIDRERAGTRELLGGSGWGQRDTYQLTVNTTGWKIKELVPAVEHFALCWFGRI